MTAHPFTHAPGAASPVPSAPDSAADSAPDSAEEQRSKDKFFDEIASLSNAMVAAHGADFAMGSLVLAARFIAEQKSFTKPAAAAAETSSCGGNCQSGTHEHKP